MTRKSFVGAVVSDKMVGTAVVAVETLKKHSLYGKRYYKTKRLKADNDKGAKEGDRVKIVSSRPRSREKGWVIAEILP